MPGIQHISIDQQMAEIGVHIAPGKMKIDRGHLEMKITTEAPQMKIERQNPTFKINRKKINAESGLKSPDLVTQDFRNSGKVGAYRGTKTAKDDGNFLGELRNPGDRVAKLAHKKSMAAIMKRKQTNLGLMPKSMPEVVWDKGQLSINWSKHSIVIDWDGEYMPQVTIDPKYSIEVFLRTEPYFRIRVEELTDLNMPGRIVDRAI